MTRELQYINSGWFDEFPLGQEEPGEQHWLDEAEKSLGGNEQDVLYYFNDMRYRGRIEPSLGTNASFGCSHAMGYGVQTPYAEIIEFANCGISGLSNDGIARMAYTYCCTYTPETIIVLWTVPHRREWVNKKGKLEKFRYDKTNVMTAWNMNMINLQNDCWDEYNLIKNKIFLRNYCDAKNINLIEFEFEDNDHAARDGMHPGSDWHANMAAKIFEKLEQL